MKMTCEKFKALIDNVGNDPLFDWPESRRKSFLVHSDACPTCRAYQLLAGERERQEQSELDPEGVQMVYKGRLLGQKDRHDLKRESN